MKPYFYKIKNKKTGQLYVGSQYGKFADPANLFTTYFTSSKLVEEAGYDNFEIVEIKSRKDARAYEAKYLYRVYHYLGKDKFLSTFLNRNISPGIINTPENIEKANEKRRISNSIAAKRRVEDGTHNFFHQVNPSTLEKNRKMHSERMKGNTFGSFRKMTPELKEKLAEASKGNTNVRGYVWVINDEGIRKRVEPNNIPLGFKRGFKNGIN